MSFWWERGEYKRAVNDTSEEEEREVTRSELRRALGIVGDPDDDMDDWDDDDDE